MRRQSERNFCVGKAREIIRDNSKIRRMDWRITIFLFIQLVFGDTGRKNCLEKVKKKSEIIIDLRGNYIIEKRQKFGEKEENFELGRKCNKLIRYKLK